jgi:hypothetical protein
MSLRLRQQLTCKAENGMPGLSAVRFDRRVRPATPLLGPGFGRELVFGEADSGFLPPDATKPGWLARLFLLWDWFGPILFRSPIQDVKNLFLNPRCAFRPTLA